jgi:hypothetical protein
MSKKIAIFYHLYQVGEWAEIYTNQIIRLQVSGLYDAADYIFVNVNGNQEMPFHLAKVHNFHHNKSNDQSTEFYAIKALYDYSCIQDSHVLFLHGKGVTWTTMEKKQDPSNSVLIENVKRWRNYLEYFNIDRWRDCINLLNDHDCVGTEWVGQSVFSHGTYNIPHYAGGIWWANSDYIKTLNPNFITNNLVIGRFATELWIGTNNPKHYNFWNSGRSLYYNALNEHEYKNGE